MQARLLLLSLLPLLAAGCASGPRAPARGREPKPAFRKVHAKVVDVLKRSNQAAIDAGSADGVYPGCVFDIYRRSKLVGRVRVEHVWEKRCGGRVFDASSWSIAFSAPGALPFAAPHISKMPRKHFRIILNGRGWGQTEGRDLDPPHSVDWVMIWGSEGIFRSGDRLQAAHCWPEARKACRRICECKTYRLEPLRSCRSAHSANGINSPSTHPRSTYGKSPA